jgi:uncharacterized protein YjbI with pentapeptide repeats
VLIGAAAAYLQFTQQQRASHDLLISNQVSKGFEQLASDKITERLGGIYALEGVMNTSPGAIIPGTDLIFAILIGANLHDAKLSSATLVGANLHDADLIGANLSNANLNGTTLVGANLHDADLSGANLTEATDVTQAQLDPACGKPKALSPGLTLDKPCPPRPGAQ